MSNRTSKILNEFIKPIPSCKIYLTKKRIKAVEEKKANRSSFRTDWLSHSTPLLTGCLTAATSIGKENDEDVTRREKSD